MLISAQKNGSAAQNTDQKSEQQYGFRHIRAFFVIIVHKHHTPDLSASENRHDYALVKTRI